MPTLAELEKMEAAVRGDAANVGDPCRVLDTLRGTPIAGPDDKAYRQKLIELCKVQKAKEAAAQKEAERLAAEKLKQFHLKADRINAIHAELKQLFAEMQGQPGFSVIIPGSTISSANISKAAIVPKIEKTEGGGRLTLS